MDFEDAKRYKLTTSSGIVTIMSREELALYIYQHNVSYRYIPKSARRGTLELFNDVIDLTFAVILYEV